MDNKAFRMGERRRRLPPVIQKRGEGEFEDWATPVLKRRSPSSRRLEQKEAAQMARRNQLPELEVPSGHRVKLPELGEAWPESVGLVRALQVLERAEGGVEEEFLQDEAYLRQRARIQKMLMDLRKENRNRRGKSDRNEEVVKASDREEYDASVHLDFKHVAFEQSGLKPRKEIDLRLWRLSVDDQNLRRFADFVQHCVELDLRGCNLVTGDGLLQILTTCKLVSVLKIAGCVRIDSSSLQVCLACCGLRLQHLDASSIYDKAEVFSIQEHDFRTQVVQELLRRKSGSHMQLGKSVLYAVARNCKNIRTLHLNNQPEVLTNDSIPILTSHCKLLSDLSFCNGSRLGLEAVTALGGLKCMTSVNVSGSEFLTDEGIHRLMKSCRSSITSLNLAKLPRLSDEGVRCLSAGFLSMIQVDVSRNKLVTDLSISYLASGCPNLQVLNIQECNGISGKGLKNLGALSRLRELNVCKCHGFGDEALGHVLNSGALCLKLQRLFMSGCENIQAEGLLTQFVSCVGSQLEVIDVSDIGDCVTDGFVRQLALVAGANLKQLNLSGNLRVSGAGLGALARRNLFLESLKISRCALVHDETMKDLKALKALQSLDLSGCSDIKELHSIPNWSLRFLSLSHFYAMTDDSLLNFICTCQELESLDISSCVRLSDQFLAKLERFHRDMPAKLSCINCYGCSFISNTAMQRCASSLGASFVEKSDIHFRGIVPSPIDLLEQYEQHEADFQSKVLRSCILIQCVFRQMLSRQKILKLQRQKYLVQNMAATQIQRIARGCLSRMFRTDLQEFLTFLALRVQFLFRRKQNLKLRLRALGFWKFGLLAGSLQSWKEHVEELVMARNRGKLEKQSKQALKLWRANVLKRLFKRWVALTKYFRWKKKCYPKAVNFFKRRSFQKCFSLWYESVAPGIFRRKHLVKIFLQCVPLQFRNSSASRSDYVVAKRYNDYLMKRMAWGNWKMLMEISRLNHASAEKFWKSKMISEEIGAIIVAWRYAAGSRKSLRDRVLQFQEQLRVRGLNRVLNSLSMFSEMKRRGRKGKLIARRAFWNAEVSKTFRTWVSKVEEMKEERVKMRRATAFMKNSLLLLVFEAWIDAVVARKTRDAKVVQSIFKLQNRAASKCFSRWVEYKSRCKEVRGVIIRRLTKERLLNVFEYWIAHTEHSKQRRNEQLQKWYRLNELASRIQARWRGVRGRERFEVRRIMESFAATKIQSRVRILLAKKAFVKAIRRRTLRNFIKMEREQDDMNKEDACGLELREEYNAARLLQVHYRARKSRDMVYLAKREMARLREIKRKDEQHQLVIEHEVKERERKRELERQGMLATKIQCAFRSYRSREVFHKLWLNRLADLAAIKIQQNQRGRVARLLAASERRKRYFLDMTRKQQQINAKVLRNVFFLRNRRQQEMAMLPLDVLGLHPDTFTLDMKKLRKEVVRDLFSWTRMARSHVKAFRIAGNNRTQRDLIIKEFYERVKDADWISKGDAVQIVSRQNPNCGLTGYVQNVHEVASIPGNAQAVVKLDESGEVVYVPMMSASTASEAGKNTMVRIESRQKDFEKSKITQKLVAQNQEQLLTIGKAMMESQRRIRAALIVQRNFRGKKFRDYLKEAYAKQQMVDEMKKARLLKILKTLRLDNARVGRILVATGLVWPRYIPELPEKPSALETWFSRQKMNREVRLHKNYQISMLKYERLHKLKEWRQQRESSMEKMEAEIANAIESLSAEEQSKMRWRVRNPFKAAYWRAFDTVTDRMLAPAAEKLKSKADKLDENDQLWKAKIFDILATVVGGPEWRRSPVERLTWVGVYKFKQLERSLHVTMDGTVVYHGTWNKQGRPHGRGVLEFPSGKGINLILAKYSSAFSKEDEKQGIKEPKEWMIEAKKTLRKLMIVKDEDELSLETNSSFEENEGDEDDEKEMEQDTYMDGPDGKHSRRGLRQQRLSVVQRNCRESLPPMRNRRRSSAISIPKQYEVPEQEYRKLQYASMMASVENGKIYGQTMILFTTGESYEGPFAEEENLERNVFWDFSFPDIESPDDVPEDFEEGILEELGCWETSDSTIYTGPNVRNHFLSNMASGMMRIEFPSGEYYLGHVVKGHLHGLGRFVFASGDEYRGQWSMDRPHGLGRYLWEETKTFYEGSFVFGKKQGFGEQLLPNGARYSGMYINDDFHGQGRLEQANSDVYEGEFVAGVFNGVGSMKYSNGAVYNGKWMNGMRHSAVSETSEFRDEIGNVFYVPFRHDLMDGQGRCIEVSNNSWRLEKFGLWKKGELVQWIKISVNPESTNEFCSHFTKYGDYNSVYALLVARSLPELPPGVDPDDRRVEQHVFGIIQRAGDVVGVNVIERSRAAYEDFQPHHEEIERRLESANLVLQKALEMVLSAKCEVEKQKKFLDEINDEMSEIRNKIFRFWNKNPVGHDAKRRYKLAVKRLRKFNRSAWFSCKMAAYTPVLWDHLGSGIAKIFMSELDSREVKPKDVQSLWNNSEMNEDVMRFYEVRLLDLIDHFDVYERSKQNEMLRCVSSWAQSHDMNPNNPVLTQICTLAGPLVELFRSAFLYVRSAQEVAENHDLLNIKRAQRKNVQAILKLKKKEVRDTEDKVRDAEKERNSCRFELENADERLRDVILSLERAEECARMAMENKKNKELILEKDEDHIIPWLSREDERILNECKTSLQDMLELLCNIEQDIWDVVFNLKELVVARTREVGGIEREVLDMMGELVNQVGGFGRAEPQVKDVLDDILFRIAGPEPEVVDVLEDILEKAVLRGSFLGQEVEVNLFRGGNEVFLKGICEEIYDVKLPIYAKPQPGTGLIYCEPNTTSVYGFEDSTYFTTELEVGFMLCIMGTSHDEVVEREIVEIFFDYHLELREEPNILSGQGWVKNWGFRVSGLVVGHETITKALINGSEVVNFDSIKLVKDEVPEVQIWQELIDQQTNHPYYHRIGTSETFWTPPPLTSHIWFQFEDHNSGFLYFHNPFTKATTWQQPS